jgi:hypothetical protein
MTGPDTGPGAHSRDGEPMQRTRVYAAVLLLGAGLTLTACQEAASSAAAPPVAPPAVVEQVADGGPAKVTLTERAEQELGLRIATVGQAADGTTTIPHGAVVYDADGSSWAFVPVDQRTYQRVPITVTQVVGDLATLTAGPVMGTEVVTVGAAFLVGAEAEISGGE